MLNPGSYSWPHLQVTVGAGWFIASSSSIHRPRVMHKPRTSRHILFTGQVSPGLHASITIGHTASLCHSEALLRATQ